MNDPINVAVGEVALSVIRNGKVPDDVWKGMLKRQLLGELSAISPTKMGGPVCTDGSEDRSRRLRRDGFLDALNKKSKASDGRDYGIGYDAATNYDGPLADPTNRELIGINR
jgi:hypothetical protein